VQQPDRRKAKTKAVGDEREIAAQREHPQRLRPELKALPVKLPDVRHPVAIVTLKRRLLSPAAQLFAEHVRKLTRPLAKNS
jgi:hypothetical protein